MNEQKRSPSPGLLAFVWWELALLLLLAAISFGAILRAPVKSFPAFALQTHLKQDPYDLQIDRASSESRPRVETGL